MTKNQFFERNRDLNKLFHERGTASCQASWIVATFPRIVFSNASTDHPTIIHNPTQGLKIFSLHDFPVTMLQSEPLCITDSDTSIENKILHILSHTRFRKGDRSIFLNHESIFREKIARAIALNKPVSLVIPTLPFQCQNPLSTGQSLEYIDLALHLMFTQLRDLVLSIEQIYRPGLRIMLLCDGIVYADFFGNSERKRIDIFRTNCDRLIRKLGMGGKIECIDMSWITENIDSFDRIQQDIRRLVTNLFETEKDEKFATAVRSLERGMIFNLPFLNLSQEQVIQLANKDTSVLPKGIRNELRNVTIGYASFILTMAFLNVVQSVFPESIRGTVHAKDAPQIALHLVGNTSGVFPYNGVALIAFSKFMRTGNIRLASRVVRLCEIPTEHEIAKVILSGHTDVFAYMDLSA